MKGESMRGPIAVALDAPNLEVAAGWIHAVSQSVDTLKVGLETFLRDGRAATDLVKDSGCRLFLDLKLHDIPNTVAGAARSLNDVAPDFLTVHASGGYDMVARAAETLPNTQITAVTLLTSLSPDDLLALGFNSTAEELVVRWAELAVRAGARAIVCSPQEVAAVRAVVPAEITLITPGVRPTGADLGDQQRVATPEAALAAGADLVVIGRPIIAALDPGKAAADIAQSLLGRAR